MRRAPSSCSGAALWAAYAWMATARPSLQGKTGIHRRNSVDARPSRVRLSSVMKTSSFPTEPASPIIANGNSNGMKVPELLPPADTMYRALVNRDSTFEGIFYVGVRTTGIFCRPTCSAKKPARENVDFFATPSEALHGGYPPFLRRHPIDPDQRPPDLIQPPRAESQHST